MRAEALGVRLHWAPETRQRLLRHRPSPGLRLRPLLQTGTRAGLQRLGRGAGSSRCAPRAWSRRASTGGRAGEAQRSAGGSCVLPARAPHLPGLVTLSKFPDARPPRPVQRHHRSQRASPGRMAQWVGAPSRTPQGSGFNSQAGHIHTWVANLISGRGA